MVKNAWPGFYFKYTSFNYLDLTNHGRGKEKSKLEKGDTYNSNSLKIKFNYPAFVNKTIKSALTKIDEIVNGEINEYKSLGTLKRFLNNEEANYLKTLYFLKETRRKYHNIEPLENN